MKRILKSRFVLTLAAVLMLAAAIALSLSGSLTRSHAANQAPPVFKLQWGTAGTGDGQFGENLQGIAVDSYGNVYVADHGNNRIQKFTSTGGYITQWPVTSPIDVKVAPDGTIFVVEEFTKRVLKFLPDGTLLGVFAQFNDAREVAFDPAGNVYIDNHFFGEVDKYDSSGNFITRWSASPFPVGIGVDTNANVYVSLNRGSGSTLKYTSDGTLLTQFPFGEFKMAIDANNNLYTADASDNRIQEFTSDGVLLTAWGTLGTGNGQFNSPQGIALDSANNVYVADANNHRIQVFSSQDTTPPTIECGAADGQWHATNVSIPCTATDTESGLANPADSNFSLTTNVANGTETADASTDTHQVCDNAENCATAGPISGNMVDKKAPSITITTPTNNATYTYQQTVPSAYSCTDGGSGLATCSGSVPNGSNVDTASVGWKTFSVTATDNVAHTASQAVSYAVKYDWSGVLQPINADGSSIFKLGSTLPVKFQLTGASAGISNAVVKLYTVKINNNVEGTVQEATSTAAVDSGNTFRYDSTSQQYIFNLSTKGLTTGTYELRFYVGGDNTTGVLQGQVIISLR